MNPTPYELTLIRRTLLRFCRTALMKRLLPWAYPMQNIQMPTLPGTSKIGDGIMAATELHLSWAARLRVLISGRVELRALIACEKRPGETQGNLCLNILPPVLDAGEHAASFTREDAGKELGVAPPAPSTSLPLIRKWDKPDGTFTIEVCKDPDTDPAFVVIRDCNHNEGNWSDAVGRDELFHSIINSKKAKEVFQNTNLPSIPVQPEITPYLK